MTKHEMKPNFSHIPCDENTQMARSLRHNHTEAHHRQ